MQSNLDLGFNLKQDSLFKRWRDLIKEIIYPKVYQTEAEFLYKRCFFLHILIIKHEEEVFGVLVDYNVYGKNLKIGEKIKVSYYYDIFGKKIFFMT